MERYIGMENHLSSIAALQSIRDPTECPQNESLDKTFDPGVLGIESYLTEEQEAQLLAEYGELISEDLFEDENVDEVL